MFSTLIESRAVPQRRTASSVASVVLHGFVITVGVIATGREVAPVSAAEPRVHIVAYDPPPPPKPTVRRVEPRRGPTARAADVAPVPSVPVIRAPVVVPVGIPDVDLSKVEVTLAPDQGRSRISTRGILCESDCATGAAIDASGRALWNSAEIAMRLSEPARPPRYPEALRRAAIEGEVVVKFVVDTTGLVDMRTVEVVRSTHDAFTAAVREALARLRFHPSVSGNQKVTALAIMPFRFTLR